MVVGFMDDGTKTGGLGPLIWPSGDFRADMMKVLEVYRTCIPKIPERAVRSIDDIVGDDGPDEMEMRACPTCRSEEHTSEFQSLMRISYAVFRLKTPNHNTHFTHYHNTFIVTQPHI